MSGWSIMDMGKMYGRELQAVSKKYGFSMDTPFKDLSDRAKKIVLYGTGDETVEMEWNSQRFSTVYTAPFEGIVNNLARRYTEKRGAGGNCGR